MLTTSQLGKSYGARALFRDVSLELNPGSRYGLVGANGSGKTTLLRVLAGDEAATEGTVSLPPGVRLGVLRQDLSLDDDRIILDLAMMGDAAVWALLETRRRTVDEGEGDATGLADIEEQIRNAGGYTLEARATAILEGLGIPVATHRQTLATLSGGFKLRVLLAQVLLGGPDVLLLDEPTNHLDIVSIRWLEKFLAAYRGAALVISHDHRFLDNIATHILDVDYETVTSYTGNYSSFVQQKRSTREQKEAEIARAEKIIAEKRAFVERFGAKATKAKQAQSRLKQIERIEIATLAPSSRRTPHFRFLAERASGREVLEAVGICKSYAEQSVLRDISLTIRRGEKLAVIGPNGLGKSTLLKIIVGHLAADAGTMHTGHEVRIGYFAQDHREVLASATMTPLEYVWAACPSEGTSYVRGQLGRALFSGADVEKPVGALSGGEAARLVFCRIIVERPNFLVLDEPTNHLDLESIGALLDALKAFEGTVVFVSHDCFFVSELATRILELTPTGPRAFPGTFSEYLEHCGDDHLDADLAVSRAKAKANAQKADAGPARALSWEDEKRRRNRLAALPAKRDKLLEAIEAAEAQKLMNAERYGQVGASREDLQNVASTEAELSRTIEKLMAEWEQVEAELAAAGEG